RSRELDRRARRRVRQSQALGMQGLSLEQDIVSFDLAPRHFAQGELRLAAIEAVAEHGAPNAGQVYANLMGTPGFGAATNGREAFEPLDDLIKRACRAAARIVSAGSHLFPLVRIVADGQVHLVSISIRLAAHQREILLFRRPRFKLL